MTAVSTNGNALYYASEELRADREIVMAAVSIDGFSLVYASEELRADREIVMTAVSNDGRALKYVSEELQADREVVLTAVSNDGGALQYASPELRAELRGKSGEVINRLLIREQELGENQDLAQYMQRLQRDEIQLPEPRLTREERRSRYEERRSKYELLQTLEEQLRQMKQKHERGQPNPRLQATERGRKLYNSNEIPNEFICPITRDIMQDPVFTLDGHTYEREVITEWFRTNNTSPITNAVLRDKTLIPNYALKSRIEEWLIGYKQEMGGGALFDF
jgi:hypothetical protein